MALLYRDGRLDAALSLARRALELREKALGPEHPDVATSLNNVAELYRATGDHARAVPLHERALAIREKALGPRHPDVATSLNNLAGLHSTRGDHARAEPLYQRALAILEKHFGPEHPEVATALNNLAWLHSTRGDHARAEPLYQRALAILEKALGPEHPEVATALNNLAGVYDAKGDYARAEPLFERALAILEDHLGPEHPDLAAPLNNLAALYKTKGEYARAEPLFKRAIAIRVSALGREHPDVAVLLDNLALLYRARGDHAHAEPLFKEALAIFEKALGPEHPSVANALNNLARLHKDKGDHARAEPLFERALTIFEKALGPEHPSVATLLNNLAELHIATGDHARAEPLFERALTILEKALGPEHPSVATLLNNLAELRSARGDHARAEPLFERALAILDKTLGPEHPSVAGVLSNLAGLRLAQGDVSGAIRMSERAAAIEDRNAATQLSVGADDAKRAYMIPLSWSTEANVSLHVQFAPADDAAKRLALTTIVRRKGRVLDAMAYGLAALRRHPSPEARSLLERLNRINADLSALMLRGPRWPQTGERHAGQPSPEQHRALVAHLEAERQQLEDVIGRHSPEVRAELSPIPLAQVQAAVPEGAALVELFRYQPFHPRATSLETRWGDPRYVAYVLRHDGDIVWADLGGARPIEDAVGDLRKALARAATDPRPAARALDALVMQPLRRLLGPTRRIMLSPDGALNLVPFGALVDEDGRYLIERHAFTYLTSGRDLVRHRATKPARQGAVVLAGPDYDRPAAPSPPSHAGAPSEASVTLRFRPLAGAAEEGRAIGRQLPGARVLLGADATEGAIKALRGPRVLHVVTHGFFLPAQSELHASLERLPLDIGSPGPGASGTALPRLGNPLVRSGLALAGANRPSTGNDDGILTALEASQLDLSGTKLVVLAACETGVGDVRSGDGVYGLRRALVIAGAETLVMSLWKVRDDATRELMQAYYGRLLAGGGRGEALRQAQLAMLATPERAHPFYWASFIVSGNDAALDGRPVGLTAARVPPHHGCGCDVAARPRAGAGAAVALLAVCALACRRRHGRGAGSGIAGGRAMDQTPCRGR
ncbi:tetratricopeptide repeat protein [Sorangium sp. So ce1182]|uniref:CHAT domain-containing tetratricopeptide repeat protein n=1 Tax=Sorangium sp. So ce1182 TaxID=3133334 RepID=UPI003F63805F